MPIEVQPTACALGAERFEEFAAQVGRRVDHQAPLMRETIERLRAAKRDPSAGNSADANSRARVLRIANWISAHRPALMSRQRLRLPPGRTAAAVAFQRGQAVLFTESIAAASPRRLASSWRMSLCRTIGDLARNRALIMRVFLPFVVGYYLSYLFRTINALIAVPLTAELGLGANDLGLLTSVYFLTFAAAQIPIGILLDRYGPRRIQSALLVIAAAGAALFAASDDFWGLLVGRALIGLGVAASLTAGLKALVIWFPGDRLSLLNGLMVMLGALGAVTATSPSELMLAWMGWRELFDLFAVMTAGCAAVVYLLCRRRHRPGRLRAAWSRQASGRFTPTHVSGAWRAVGDLCRNSLGAAGIMGGAVAV